MRLNIVCKNECSSTWTLWTSPFPVKGVSDQFWLLPCFLEMPVHVVNAISVDLDQTSRSVASDLGLHCLPVFHFGTLGTNVLIKVIWRHNIRYGDSRRCTFNHQTLVIRCWWSNLHKIARLLKIFHLRYILHQPCVFLKTHWFRYSNWRQKKTPYMFPMFIHSI